MEEVSPKNVELAKSLASPFILRILKNFSVEDLDYAVENHVNLVDWLKQNSNGYARLKNLLRAIPFKKRILPHIGSEAWIGWFISNELQHNLPDWYVRIAYNPKYYEWLRENLEQLAKFL